MNLYISLVIVCTTCFDVKNIVFYPHSAIMFGVILIIQAVSLNKVNVTLRPTISRPLRLGVRRPSGTRDQFFYFL
jgi:hypothetical protein